MRIRQDLLERLPFLDRVAQREVRHLEETSGRRSAGPFTEEQAAGLDEDHERSERPDAFVARFSRLQDTPGDKRIPQLLSAPGERRQALIDHLDQAERFGRVESTDRWMAIRALRNRMIHEYMEETKILVSAIHRARDFVPELAATARRIHEALIRRGWAEEQPNP